MSSATEHDFTKHLIAGIKKWNAYVIHQSGGMFQAGQPDLRITNDQGPTITPGIGFTIFAELKMWRNKAMPQSAAQIINLLEGPQICVIKHELWKRNAFCPVIAQVATNLRVCYAAYKDKITVTDFDSIAKGLATFDVSEQWIKDLLC